MSHYADRYRAAFLKRSAAPYLCFFCGVEITLLKGQTRWALNVHHIDGNHSNNDPDNWASTHNSCHTTHHHKGKKVSAETKKKIGDTHRGMKRSSATRAKMSAAAMGNQKGLGKTHTSEERARISQRMKGNKNGLGNKGSVDRKGVPWTAARRAAYEQSKGANHEV